MKAGLEKESEWTRVLRWFGNMERIDEQPLNGW